MEIGLRFHDHGSSDAGLTLPEECGVPNFLEKCEEREATCNPFGQQRPRTLPTRSDSASGRDLGQVRTQV